MQPNSVSHHPNFLIERKMADKETRKNLASTNQIFPFSYWLCESRIGPDLFRIGLVFRNYCFPILDSGQAKFTIYRLIRNS